MKQVTVKRMFNGEVDNEFSDAGVFYPNQGVVISVDQFGLIEVFNAKPVEGEDVVILEQDAECLANDNPQFVIDLIMNGK
jgi:hypothetical protein